MPSPTARTVTTFSAIRLQPVREAVRRALRHGRRSGRASGLNSASSAAGEGARLLRIGPQRRERVGRATPSRSRAAIAGPSGAPSSSAALAWPAATARSAGVREPAAAGRDRPQRLDASWRPPRAGRPAIRRVPCSDADRGRVRPARRSSASVWSSWMREPERVRRSSCGRGPRRPGLRARPSRPSSAATASLAAPDPAPRRARTACERRGPPPGAAAAVGGRRLVACLDAVGERLRAGPPGPRPGRSRRRDGARGGGRPAPGVGRRLEGREPALEIRRRLAPVEVGPDREGGADDAAREAGRHEPARAAAAAAAAGPGGRRCGRSGERARGSVPAVRPRARRSRGRFAVSAPARDAAADASRQARRRRDGPVAGPVFGTAPDRFLAEPPRRLARGGGTAPTGALPAGLRPCGRAGDVGSRPPGPARPAAGTAPPLAGCRSIVGG